MAIGANKGRNEDKRRLRDEVGQGQFVNRIVLAHHRKQPVYNDDLEEEEDFLFSNHHPTRGGGKFERDHKSFGGDF